MECLIWCGALLVACALTASFTRGYLAAVLANGDNAVYAGVTDAQGERGYAGCSADRIECNDASEQCSQHDGRVEVMVRPVS